jgi:WD40 repeat protein
MPPVETRFAVLLFTDIVGSTDLKVRFGVPAFGEALRVHNGHFERLAGQFRGIRILQNMGDGYFAEAGGVAEAVRFALLFQDAMRGGPWGKVVLKTRVGIHAGEIGALDVAGGSGIVAPAADLAARVMGLALGGQILLTRFPFDEARHFIRDHPGEAGKAMPPLRWLAHGPYLMKGRDEPVEVFEVGADGLAPLHAPPGGDKARRAIRPGEEETLGWRPAAGLEIPGRPGWRLVDRLGAGGFGEVWEGGQPKLGLRRAFKFCFDDQRLRALKREVTLVRLLRSALGDRDDIVRIHEIKLDEPPFYLESDLAPHGNLLQWAEQQGGLENIPLATRIGLAAHAAAALGAAHGVGVLHKDIKPTNILIFDGPDGGPRPRLVDFGIGGVAEPGLLGHYGMTGAGFTRATLEPSSGTPTYSPPEYLAGRPYTVQGDIYGLGVLLYQLVTAKAQQPLAVGWERDVADPLLREDIAACVDGDPARRLASATELAERLLHLEQRREEIEEHQRLTRAEAEAVAARAGAARLRRLAGAFAALALLAVAGGVLAWVSRSRMADALGEVERQRVVVENKHAEVERQIAATHRHIAEAAQKAWGTARDAFEAGRDPRTGFAHLAEALRYNSHLPPGQRLAGLEEDAAQRVLGWPLLDPFPLCEPIRHDDSVTSVCFSPDGRLLVTASWDGTARLWDAATHQPIGRPMRHENWVECANFSPDGRLVVTASRDGSARLWDAATGEPAGEPMQLGSVATSANFSPDGRLVVTASRDGTARLWDAATGAPVGGPMQHGNGVAQANFSPDGRLVVTACADAGVRLWDVATGEMTGGPMRHDDYVFSAAISPEGSRVVSASLDKTARLWDLASGSPVGEPMRHGDGVAGACFSPDGRLVATASWDGTTRLWSAATGQAVGRPMRHGKGVANACFSPDGRLLATACADHVVRLWHTAVEHPAGLPMRHEHGVTAAAFSPAEDRILATAAGRVARLWDTASGRPVGTPMDHDGEVGSLCFSPDGRLLATACGDKTARLWEVATGRPAAPPMRHDEQVESAAFSPDGRLVVTASRDKTVRLWETGTSRPVGRPMQHEDFALAANFSPDGRLVVSAAWDGSVRLWDAASGTQAGTPMQHEGVATSACFSPDGSRVITACADMAARLWDAATGMPAGAPLRHADGVAHAGFSPDGRHIVTASLDGTARLWDAATGKPAGEPMRQGNWVTSAGFSRQGCRVVTSGLDMTARLWEIVFPLLEPGTVDPGDLAFLAGRRINQDGEAVDIPHAELGPWRREILARDPGPGALWPGLLRWKLSDPARRTLGCQGRVSAAEHIEREITWAMAHLEQVLFTRNSGILTGAHALDPAHPLIHVALAAVEENPASRRLLREFGLKRLVADEAVAVQAEHQSIAGTYRAKAAVILWLQDDRQRAAQVFAGLLERHDPQRQTWGAPAWIGKLDDFEWPAAFRGALVELARTSGLGKIR